MDFMFTQDYEKDYFNTYYTSIVDFNAVGGYFHTHKSGGRKNLHSE